MEKLLDKINTSEDLNVEHKSMETPQKPKEKFVTVSSLASQYGISSYSYRKANFFQQLYYLVKRNFIGAIRNPRGMHAVLF